MRGASIDLVRLRRNGLRVGVAALLMAVVCALGGCASGGATNNAYAMAASNGGGGPTIAFEQIDGAPPQVFDRMVGILDSETKLRNLAIVSREAPAAYRVRSYLSAEIVRGHTMIAWVWDVYDRDQRRALRLSGEEPGGKTGREALRDPWAAADDLVLRKIAQAGLSGLSGMIGGAPESPSTTPPASGGDGPAVADAQPAAAPAGSYHVSALGYTDR